MNAQTLLVKLVDMAGGPAEEGYLLALADPALAELPDSFRTPRALYRVFRPASELALRRLLWKMSDAPLVAIVDRELADRLPPDLVRRARGGMVHALELRDVLEVALGVCVIPPEDPAMQDLVVQHIDELHRALGRRTLPTRVGRDLLEQLLLEVLVGDEVREASPGALLASWLRQSPSSRWDEPVRRLLAANLPTLQGPSGAILAWALDDDARLREICVRGLLLSVDTDEIPPTVWGEILRPLLADDISHGLEPAQLRRTLQGMAIGACDHLGDEERALLTEAEREGREKLPPKVLASSRVLPLGLESSLVDLASHAAKGGAITASEVAWLREHRAARFHESEIGVVEQMARLSRYLAVPTAAGSNVVERVTAYQSNGAFADLTAMRLRRSLASTGHFHSEAAALLEQWRARRDEENHAFAEALAGDYSTALFADGITPLPRLWKHQGLPELTRAERQGLYLVVLDGCSYAVFLELVFDLYQHPKRPLGFRPAGDAPARGLPALAPLPTITSHARGSIFLGELPEDPLVPESVWREQGEGVTDSARLNRNPTLGGRTRRLFLKGDLADGGGALFTALDDPSLEVVAAVFNVVDDMISSSATGAAFEVHADRINAFIPSLRRALDRGRSVLIVADHGFSPHLSSALRAGDGDSHRYTTLAPDASVPDGFIELDLGGLGGALEDRTAFAWKVGAYLRRPQVGYHGGCGLEEMVVPMAWIEDSGLPPDLPPWWVDVMADQAEMEREASADVELKPAALTKAEPPPRPAPVAQIDLFDEKPSADELVALLVAKGLPSALVEELNSVQRQALRTLSENGSARVSDLAGAAERKPGRMRQMLTRLQQKLHAAGTPCLRSEELPDGEVQFLWTPPEGGAS